jgi:hypothetical protein
MNKTKIVVKKRGSMMKYISIMEPHFTETMKFALY